MWGRDCGTWYKSVTKICATAIAATLQAVYALCWPTKPPERDHADRRLTKGGHAFHW